MRFSEARPVIHVESGVFIGSLEGEAYVLSAIRQVFLLQFGEWRISEGRLKGRYSFR